MEADFNPLKSRMLFERPQRLHVKSTWNSHVPFAMLLMELQQPRILVELGTHWGISYCAFCQAVEALRLPTRCYAVDTWVGDSDAGYYSQEVYENLQQHHRQYESFSKLMRMTFQEARQQVADKSVDLLHIDGLHSYEAVKEDYETWRPKMSERGVVLFHDTMVTDRGFGVHKLWREISGDFPHFNFEHGFGLGVLAVGPKTPDAVVQFLRSATAWPAAARALFMALGHQWQCEVATEAAKAEQQARAARPFLRRAMDKLKK
jgi:O-antigen biosynthesis protein